MDDSIDSIRLVNKRFNIINIDIRIKQCMNKAFDKAKGRKQKYQIEMNEMFQFINPPSTITEYHLIVLGKYVDAKNNLFELAKNYIYSNYKTNKNDQDFIENICYNFLQIKNEKNIDKLLNNFENELADVILYDDIINLPEHLKSSMPTEFMKKTVTTYKYFEETFIEALMEENQQLKDDKFKHDDIYANYMFNLNVVSLRVLYDYLKANNLLHETVNYGKFAHMLYPKNEWVIDINLRKSNLTFPDFSFLIMKLKEYFKGVGIIEYKSYLSKKLNIISKHKKQKSAYDIEYKTTKTFNKITLENLNPIEKDIYYMFKTISEIEKENTF